MPDLKIPYASLSPFLSTMVHANNADKANPYYCPCCSTRLILRNGDIRVKHFSHPVGSCSAESIYHSTAKSLILDIFREGRFYDIKFPAVCDNCNSLPIISFPKSVTSLSLEYKLNNYVYDIVCFSGSSAIFAIEICYSHKVDTLKSRNSFIPIFEFQALDVLSNPYCYSCPPILHRSSWSHLLGSVNFRSCCINYAIEEADRLAVLKANLEHWEAKKAFAIKRRELHDKTNQRAFKKLDKLPLDVQLAPSSKTAQDYLYDPNQVRLRKELESVEEKLRLLQRSPVQNIIYEESRCCSVEDLERRGLW